MISRETIKFAAVVNMTKHSKRSRIPPVKVAEQYIIIKSRRFAIHFNKMD